MDIHEYLGVLRRGIVLILLGVLLGIAGGFAAQSMEHPSYSATSRELLTNKVAGDLSISQGRIASYVLVASSGLVLQPVIDELKLDTTVDALARNLTVVAPPNTLVIEITGTAATPEAARDITNAVSRTFAEVVADQLETTTGVTPTGAPTPAASDDPSPKPSPSTTKLPNGTVVPITVPTAPVRVVNLEQAALPEQPNASAGPLMLLVGGVLGLALGLLAASLREAVDRRVRTPRDVARVTSVPVVGAIVADRRIRTTPLTARAGSRSPSAESFRAVRAHLDHLRERDGRRIFVLTAAGRGQGTTTVAANLAIALANTGTSVVVVDADLRRPDLTALFDLQSSPGLSGLLAGRADLDQVLRGSGTPGLTVVPAGSPAVNAGELIATPRMRTLLAELARRFEVVIVDTPTIVGASDAAVLGALTGSTLLIVAQGDTTRPRLDDALALLEAGGSEPIGIVLTRTRRAVAGRAPQAPVAQMPVLEHRAVQDVAVAPVAPVAPVTAEAPPVLIAPEPVAQEALARGAAAPEAVAREAVAPDVVPVPEPAPVSPVGTAVAVRTPEPSHLAEPLPKQGAPSTPSAPRDTPRTSRRVTRPASTSPVPAAEPATAAPAPQRAERTPRRVTQPPTSVAPGNEVGEKRVERAAAQLEPKPEPKPASKPAAKAPDAKADDTAAPKATSAPAAKATEKPAKPAATSAPEPVAPSETLVVTEIEHTLGSARDLDYAFAALPTATAAEQRAGTIIPDIDDAELIERPIVIRPDTPRTLSRFAPDPTRFSQRMSGAYAAAPAPTAGTAGRVPEAPVTGTVVNTVSIRVQRDAVEAATVPPPIRHILPRPTSSTIPPRAVEASRTPAVEPEPQLVEVRPKTGPVPVPPLAREPLPEAGPVTAAGVDDDPTAETPSPESDGETRAIPVVGSLLGEIGGLQRVEVRAARPSAVTDTAPNPERQARESYELRARDLERAAHERLMREQQRLAVNIREQLAHDKRELESVLDNRLEDTVLRPLELPARFAEDPRFSDPSDDNGDTR
jgi:capsular exopolysaccharide synthesis family protein